MTLKLKLFCLYCVKRRHEKQGQKRIQDQKKNYFKLLKRLTQGSHQVDPI